MKKRLLSFVVVIGMALPLNAEERVFQVVGRIYGTWNEQVFTQKYNELYPLNGGMMAYAGAAWAERAELEERLSKALDEFRDSNPALFDQIMQRYGLTLKARQE